MIIRSVKLSNIRSYTCQQIDFPEGSVLLSGDIGSGKSTVLLAIEFALFGIKAGELSGEALLRHGAKEGSVELAFTVDGKEVYLKRSLKRTKDAIKQESGYIIIDGVKTDATAVELKSRVYELMGYPSSLLLKSKDLIYRYTVYTPQDQMKHILAEDKDARLDTLRRVFAIDKYKRIRENALDYAREMKSRKRELEAKAYDLEDRKTKKSEQETELMAYQVKLDDIMPMLRSLQDEITRKRLLIEEARAKTQELNRTRSELAVLETRQKNLLDQRRKNLELVEQLEHEVKRLDKQDRDMIDPVKIKEEITQTEKQIDLQNRKLRDASSKKAEFSALSKASSEVSSKISELDKCPLCEQTVGSEHKESISKRENEKIHSYAESVSLVEKQESAINEEIHSLKLMLDGQRKKEATANIQHERKRQMAGLQERISKTNEEQGALKAMIGELNMKHAALLKLMDDNKGTEERWGKLEKEFSALIENEKLLQIQKESVTARMENNSKLITQLEAEIAIKQKLREDAGKIGMFMNWLQEGFISLTAVIERHVMGQIFLEFNQLFVSWFSMLIDDELLSVRLDDEFTPVISQNGYESTLDNLSGGEKTSVALAYRLALNKVVNDFISHIRTKDLIMLDEPTDGFSTEQLDKVREVLEQLGTRQVIVVSHEPKIESFVDTVIRISKDEHISTAEH